MPSAQTILLDLQAVNNASGTLNAVSRDMAGMDLAAVKLARTLQNQARSTEEVNRAIDQLADKTAHITEIGEKWAAGAITQEQYAGRLGAAYEAAGKAAATLEDKEAALARQQERSAQAALALARASATVSNDRSRQQRLLEPPRIEPPTVVPTIPAGATAPVRRVALAEAAQDTVTNRIVAAWRENLAATVENTAAQAAYNDIVTKGAAKSIDGAAAEDRLTQSKTRATAASREFNAAITEGIAAQERVTAATEAADAAQAKQALTAAAAARRQQQLLAPAVVEAPRALPQILPGSTAPMRRLAFADAAVINASNRADAASAGLGSATTENIAAFIEYNDLVAKGSALTAEGATAAERLASSKLALTAASREANAAFQAEALALEKMAVAEEAAAAAGKGGGSRGSFKYGYGGFSGGLGGNAGTAVSRVLFGPEALIGGALIAGGAKAAEADYNLSATVTGAVATSTVNPADVKAIQAALPGIAAAAGNHVTQQQLADAVYPVLSRGFSREDSLAVLKQGAIGAEVTGIGGSNAVSPADYTTALVGAISAFGAKASEAPAYNATLNTVINKGSAEAADIPGALGRFGASAAAAGADFKQAGAVFANLTNLSIPADEAGQDLNAFYQSSLHVNRGEQQAAERLGVERGPNAIRDAGGTANYLRQIDLATGGDKSLISDLFGNDRAARVVLGSTGEFAAGYQAIDKAVQGSNDQNLTRGKHIVEGTDFASVDSAINKLKDDLTTGLGSALQKTTPQILALIDGIRGLGSAAGAIGNAIDTRNGTDIGKAVTGFFDVSKHLVVDLVGSSGLTGPDLDKAIREALADQQSQTKTNKDVNAALKNPSLITPALLKEVGDGPAREALENSRNAFAQHLAAIEHDSADRPPVPPAPTIISKLPGLPGITAAPQAPVAPTAPPVERIKEQRLPGQHPITVAPSGGVLVNELQDEAQDKAVKADAKFRQDQQRKADAFQKGRPQALVDAQNALQIDDTLRQPDGSFSKKDLARVKKDTDTLIKVYTELDSDQISDKARALGIATAKQHERAIEYANEQYNSAKLVADAQEAAATAADRLAKAQKSGSVTATVKAIGEKEIADTNAVIQRDIQAGRPQDIIPDVTRIQAKSGQDKQGALDTGTQSTLNAQALKAQQALTAAQDSGNLPAQLAALKQARDIAIQKVDLADRDKTPDQRRKDEAPINAQYGVDTSNAKRGDKDKAIAADLAAAQLNLSTAQRRGNLAQELAAIQAEQAAQLRANAVQFRGDPNGLKQANAATIAGGEVAIGAARAQDAGYGVRGAQQSFQAAQFAGNAAGERAAAIAENAFQKRANAGNDVGRPRDLKQDNNAADLELQGKLKSINLEGPSRDLRAAQQALSQAQFTGDKPGQRAAILAEDAAQKRYNAINDPNLKDRALDNSAADLAAQQQLRVLDSSTAQTNLTAAQLGVANAQFNFQSVAQITAQAKNLRDAAIALAESQGLTGKDLKNAKDAANQALAGTVRQANSSEDQNTLRKLTDAISYDQARGAPITKDVDALTKFQEAHKGRDDLNLTEAAIQTQRIGFLGIDTRRQADVFKAPQQDLGFLNAGPGSSEFRISGNSGENALVAENRRLREQVERLENLLGAKLDRIGNNTEGLKIAPGHPNSLAAAGGGRGSR